MAEGVNGGVGNIELFSGHHDEPLQRSHRHGFDGPVHAPGQLVGGAGAASGVWKEQDRVTMESPVAAQVLQHHRCQGHHPVPPALAAPDHQLAFVTENVADLQ